MQELTDHEYAILMIAREGEYMAPIGQWKEPIEALTARGLMQRLDAVNYVITIDGRKSCAEREDEDARALLNASNKVAQARSLPVRLKRRRESVTADEVLEWMKRNGEGEGEEVIEFVDSVITRICVS